MNIGCIECGVSSNIVGVFETEERANEVACICQREYGWREGGQNSFDVFDMPEIGKIHGDYTECKETP